MPVIHVVAAAVIDPAGRILIAQRPPGRHLAGGWEFPGGKLEPGEARPAGLARELREELGITIHDPRPLIRLRHTYAYGGVLLDIWVVNRFDGEPRGLDGQSLRWCHQEELEDERATADLLPADRPIVRALRLPERLLERSTPYYRVGGDAGAGGSATAGRAGAARLRGAFCSTVAAAEALCGAVPGGWAEAGRAGASDAEVGTAAVRDRSEAARDGSGAARHGSGAARHGSGARVQDAVDFLVLRSALSPKDLAGLCRSVAVPVYARGLELEAAWELGATGVSQL